MKKILAILIGIALYPFLKFWPISEKRWVFGAQNGNAYIDNSKYLFEFVLKNHQELKPIWITRSYKTFRELKKRHLPVAHNLSIFGLWYVATAHIVAFSTTRSDILFVHPKRKRKIVNLWHGMPMKKIVYDYAPHRPENKNWKGNIWDKLVVPFSHKHVALIPATSKYFQGILTSAFRNNNVFVTGQPRTDVFFQWNSGDIKKELGFQENDKIITYMPTHRAYGKGELNPRIFEQNKSAIEYFEQNNIKLVWKFHKNMLDHYNPDNETLSISLVDLTAKQVDPQKLLFISDILITDYSSCYIDYLLLKRPVLFYLYDNYETDDNELYFKPQDHFGEMIAQTEEKLLHLIRSNKTLNNSIYHDHFDGSASQRIYDKICLS